MWSKPFGAGLGSAVACLGSLAGACQDESGAGAGTRGTAADARPAAPPPPPPVPTSERRRAVQRKAPLSRRRTLAAGFRRCSDYVLLAQPGQPGPARSRPGLRCKVNPGRRRLSTRAVSVRDKLGTAPPRAGSAGPGGRTPSQDARAISAGATRAPPAVGMLQEHAHARQRRARRGAAPARTGARRGRGRRCHRSPSMESPAAPGRRRPARLGEPPPDSAHQPIRRCQPLIMRHMTVQVW